LDLEDFLPELTAIRHRLHEMPELALTEYRTADLVAQYLESWGLELHRGLAGTGIVATLRRGTSNRSVGLRADMDALEIAEETNLSYASKSPGLMHACGHDGHTAMLLGAARMLSQQSDLDGTVHFIFQPAEESNGGGKRMIDAGLFERFHCDRIFALHNLPGLTPTYRARTPWRSKGCRCSWA
jgi:hippurate hydrolase